MKLRLTRNFSLEMAHALYGYDGPCRNIHGHSYVFSVTVTGRPLADPSHPKNGMVMDFSELKRLVQEHIVGRFDHALVLNGDSPHRSIGALEGHFEKLMYVHYQPTCENLLIDFVEILKKALPKDVVLHRARLRETASSYAEWFAEDNPES